MPTNEQRQPQLVHSARQMFETRWAKYNDPKNHEWDFDDIRDKWERHAWSAYVDLIATEQERDALIARVQKLEETLENIARAHHGSGAHAPNFVTFEECKRASCVTARAALNQE